MLRKIIISTLLLCLSGYVMANPFGGLRGALKDLEDMTEVVTGGDVSSQQEERKPQATEEELAAERDRRAKAEAAEREKRATAKARLLVQGKIFGLAAADKCREIRQLNSVQHQTLRTYYRGEIKKVIDAGHITSQEANNGLKKQKIRVEGMGPSGLVAEGHCRNQKQTAAGLAPAPDEF